ncbi:MAG: DUF3124 domain-containing protein [Bacteroidia bacterium]
MKKAFLSLIFIPLIFLFSGCNTPEKNEKIHLPSPVYNYVEVQDSLFTIKQSVYVPIYSNIYLFDGSKTQQLTATLSIRNISFKDSLYVKSVNYYGSQGEILKQYTKSTILVKPMSSIEFVVEQTETKGGPGANFVVDWAAVRSANSPLIQAVINSNSHTSVSFVTYGIVIK